MYVTPNQKWQTAYQTIKTNFSLGEDAIGVFAIQLQFNLDDIKSIASESITGGGNDRKCDVLHIDREMGVAVVAQCYVAKTKKAAAKANKAADLNTAVSWLLSADINSLDRFLAGRAQELREAILAGDIKQFHCWYVHNLPASQNVRDELKTVEQTARNALRSLSGKSHVDVFASEIGADAIESLYTKAERPIIVTDTFEIQVPDVIEHKEQDWSSISTYVRGDWLAGLYRKYQTDLFSANLRGYLGSRSSDKNINNGIKRTVSEEPFNFLVYNNGITSLVIDYKYGQKTKSGRKLEITGVSIVNGAQTTGSIASVKEDVGPELLVGVRFVRAHNVELIEKIVKFNNSQNKLEAADFRSNDNVQDRLRQEFSAIPNAEYEGGRRGGASDAIKRSKYTLPSYTVGQSLVAFHGEPVFAYDKKSEIWIDDRMYARVFTDRTSAHHIVFCFSILEAIRNRRLSLIEKQKRTPTSLTSIENNTLEFLNKKGSQFLLIFTISQCLETILDTPIPNKFDIKFKLNESPFKLSSEWDSILKIILPLSGQLEDAFAKGRITSEGVKQTVPKFSGVFASVASAQKTTLQSFAKKINLA